MRDIVTGPQYLDINVNPNTEYIHLVEPGHTVFTYTLTGSALFGEEMTHPVNPENLIVYENGYGVRISTAEDPVRFLLVSGKPVREPIAWRGPIVMNTDEELLTAFEEYRTGRFIKQASYSGEALSATALNSFMPPQYHLNFHGYMIPFYQPASGELNRRLNLYSIFSLPGGKK